MGFDITVSRYDVGKCPHCGKPIKDTMQDYEYSGGRVWKEYLEKIGYYVPYEIRCAWLRRWDEVHRRRSQESTYHRPRIPAAYGALDKR